MARNRRKRGAPALASVPRLAPAATKNEEETPNLIDQHRTTDARDTLPSTSERLPRPSIPPSWDMRSGATDLNTSELPEGPETVRAALQALMDTNDPAYLFVRFNRLTSVQADERGLPKIIDVDHPYLRGLLMRAAYWKVAVKLRSGERDTRATQVPGYVPADVLAHGDWPFSPLRGISAIPVLRADGTLHTTPGFDEQSGYWYEPSLDLAGFHTPEHITEADVRAAAIVLDAWLVDFPYETEAEQANARALYLTLLALPAIAGNTPLAITEAVQSRTGKTVHTEVLFLAALGTLPALSGIPAEESEMAKMLAGLALTGKQYCIFDNVRGPVNSPSLERVLTSGSIAQRLVYEPGITDLTLHAVFVVTANGFEATTDQLKRS
jgi:hypothetical protein